LYAKKTPPNPRTFGRETELLFYAIPFHAFIQNIVMAGLDPATHRASVRARKMNLLGAQTRAGGWPAQWAGHDGA
jgi:hypothetical protein